jgi:hypothetical protein
MDHENWYLKAPNLEDAGIAINSDRVTTRIILRALEIGIT